MGLPAPLAHPNDLCSRRECLETGWAFLSTEAVGFYMVIQNFRGAEVAASWPSRGQPGTGTSPPLHSTVKASHRARPEDSEEERKQTPIS